MTEQPRLRRIIPATAAVALIAASATVATTASAKTAGANGKIAFSSTRTGTWEIYVLNGDGSATQLTDTARNSVPTGQSPSWSSDGLHIAYMSNGAIHVMNPDGSGDVTVTPPGETDSQPDWSPDSSQLVFSQVQTTGKHGTTNALVLLNVAACMANPSSCHETTLLATGDTTPAWSPLLPDGTSRIAFEQNGGISWIDPAQVNVAMSQRHVTPIVSDGLDPAWSPDGSALAFAQWQKALHIWRVDADGTGAHQLTFVTYLDRSPDWSPDGTTIVYRHSDSSQGSSLYTVPAAGGDPAALTTSTGTGRAATYDAAPTWQSLSPAPPTTSCTLPPPLPCS